MANNIEIFLMAINKLLYQYIHVVKENSFLTDLKKGGLQFDCIFLCVLIDFDDYFFV